MRYMNGPRALILVLGGIVLTGVAATAVAEAVQGSVGAGGLLAYSTHDGPVVEAPAGDRTATILPAASRVQAVVELADGWALAATVPTRHGQRATVLVGEDGRQRRLPRLPGRPAAVQERPSPLAVDGQLLGLAWLEGDDYTSLAVRAADWDGRRWSAAETVALPMQGSQMALDATVLGDGSPLLVWSRFDGGDDEVVFSVRDGGGWTSPRAIHPANEVPDILPRVVATGTSGALAAWSELIDGDYRVLISRFDGTHWSAPRRLPGLGTTVERLRLDGSRALLLYASTAPRAWMLAEIDPQSARLRRIASTTRQTETAPVVDTGTGDAALIWPDSGRRVVPGWRGPAAR